MRQPTESWNGSSGPCRILVISWDLSPLTGNSLQEQVAAICHLLISLNRELELIKHPFKWALTK
jgi:hypothetical protein